VVKILQSIHIKRFEFKKTGANDEIRTRDLRFTKPLLYQLSYIGVGYGGDSLGWNPVLVAVCRPESNVFRELGGSSQVYFCGHRGSGTGEISTMD
jgi:hypothetical protein